MSKLHNISVHTMRSIFDCIVDQHPLIFWMRTPDLKKTIYISKTFDEQFNISRDKLYNGTQTLKDFLLDDTSWKSNESAEKLRVAQPAIVQEQPNEFKLLSENKTIITIRDRSFPIHDTAGNIIATAGIAENFTHATGNRAALKMHANDFTIRFQNLQSEIDDALMQEFQSKTNAKSLPLAPVKQVLSGVQYHLDGAVITFSPRQAQCLTETLKGHSAKIVAYNLNLSKRTVEEYLDNVRKRLNCRTKLELVSKVSTLISTATC